jgi:prepilin-type N-terminal cleavage/methylation domain-containing protein
MESPRHPSRSAFTLIELLVVLGIMALFIGVFSTALRPGSPTVAVEGAQAQLASLLTQARGVAVLKNAQTRLIIHNDDTNPDRYLRFAGIVYMGDKDGDGTDEWTPATDGVLLPNMVYAYTGAPSNMDSGFDVQYISNSTEGYAYIEFNPNGTVEQVSSKSPVLAVGSGQPGPDGVGVEFDSENIRGAIVRQYGSFVLLNEPDAFPSN